MYGKSPTRTQHYTIVVVLLRPLTRRLMRPLLTHSKSLILCPKTPSTDKNTNLIFFGRYSPGPNRAPTDKTPIENIAVAILCPSTTSIDKNALTSEHRTNPNPASLERLCTHGEPQGGLRAAVNFLRNDSTATSLSASSTLLPSKTHQLIKKTKIRGGDAVSCFGHSNDKTSGGHQA